MKENGSVKQKKPWNALLIIELLLPLVNYGGFALTMLSVEGGWPDWCGAVGAVLYWTSVVLAAAGVLGLPFQIWKRRFFSLPLLIAAAAVNVVLAALLVWFLRGQILGLGL